MNQDRYYTKFTGTWRIYDRKRSYGTGYICIADCNWREWIARIIVTEMNKGLPYRPDTRYNEYDPLIHGKLEGR